MLYGTELVIKHCFGFLNHYLKRSFWQVLKTQYMFKMLHWICKEDHENEEKPGVGKITSLQLQPQQIHMANPIVSNSVARGL